MKKIFSDKRAIVIFLLPAALVYAIFAIYPVIMSGYYSLLDWNGVGDAKFIGLSNYVKLFVGNNDGFGSALLNSFILAFLSVFVQLTLSLVLALAITYPKVKKQERFYRTVYFLPAIVSTVIIAELWKKIYHPSYGLLNGFLGMLGLESWQREWLGDTETALIAVFIPIVWQYIGNHMLMMYSAIKGVPNELLEAACIDGASYLQTCFLVTIPMIKDMIIVCVTFAIVGSLKVFDLVYVMTNGGPLHATEVPGTLMYSAIFQKNQYGYGSAIAVFIVLECVLFTFASRWLMNRAFGDDRETKTSRRKGGAKMKTLQKPKLPHSSGLVLTTIVLMTVALVQIFPFYWMLTFSLKSNADIYGGNIAGLPTTLHFENYVKAFTTGNIGVYLKKQRDHHAGDDRSGNFAGLYGVLRHATYGVEISRGGVCAVPAGVYDSNACDVAAADEIAWQTGAVGFPLGIDLPLHRVWATVCNLHFVRLYARDPAGTGGSGLHRRLQHIPDLFPRYHAAAETGNFHHRDFYVSERMERIDVGNDIYQRRFQKNADLRDHEF